MDSCEHPRCRNDSGDCEGACSKEDEANAAFDMAVKEAGFARLAYDQLVARQDQDKERLLGRICMAIEAQSLEGWSESTVAHFRQIVVDSAKG